MVYSESLSVFVSALACSCNMPLEELHYETSQKCHISKELMGMGKIKLYQKPKLDSHRTGS